MEEYKRQILRNSLNERFMLQNVDVLIWSKLISFLFFLNINVSSAQDTLAVQYSLSARGTFKEGKLNQTIISSGGYYGLTAQNWKTEVFANYNYLKTNGRLGENEFLGRVLISFYPKKRWFPVIGYIYNISEFYQIQNRHTPGLGVGLKLLENKVSTINLHAWAAYDHTEFKTIRRYNTFRINTFLIGTHKLIPDKLSFQYLVYYLQSLEQSVNYIWRIEPTLLFQISKRISLSINLESHYENIIAPGNTKRNSVLTVGVKFQNK